MFTEDFRTSFSRGFLITSGLCLAITSPLWADLAPGRMQPIAEDDLVFEEMNGLVAVEAEHFIEQTDHDVRGWYLTTADLQAGPMDPDHDADPAHVGGASGGAYLECLPDTRHNHGHKLINGENFANTPGVMAILSYKVRINSPGRYYVWVRCHSTGSEDNGLHVGIDGTWPESGQRLQWCEGKNTWRWESKQRTEKQHCGEPYKIYLDIEKAGEHTIHFCMREDGFEFDKFILTKDREFKRPEDEGPAPCVYSGKLPDAFALVAAPAPVPKASSSAKAQVATTAGRPNVWLATEFPVAGTHFYVDEKNRCLAVNPDHHKGAAVTGEFPFRDGRYDVTLLGFGENDGSSEYEVQMDGTSIGTFTAPLGQEQFERGARYNKTWKNVAIKAGAKIEVRAKVGSKDGVEFSRARWSGLRFKPADGKALGARLIAVEETLTDFVPPTAPLIEPRQPDGDGTVTMSGELKQWHKVTFTLNGPFAHELDTKPNPFMDYRLTVRCTHESGSPDYHLPGYFAADGNAGETSAQAGTHWKAHLSPDKAGTWNYLVTLEQGPMAAIDSGKGTPIAKFTDLKGSFEVAESDKTGIDLRAKGRLQYVGKHYLQFAGDKTVFVKAGPDAPETLLAYQDFDGTVTNKQPLKDWAPHVNDWKEGDPTWKGGKGKGLIGALNYLAEKGLNTYSFLPYNAGGDGDNVWPFVARDAKFHYDCSKLDQWGVVFDHAQSLGLHHHFKLQETENDDNNRGHQVAKIVNVPTSLDGGDLGPERKLYCRQIVARFGHLLALNWNLGEENTQTPEQQRAMAAYIKEVDPYDHHLVIHTYPNQQDKVYFPLLGNQSVLTGASLQNSWSAAHQRTLKWIEESAKAGKPWVVANDEQGSASLGVPPDPGYKGFDGNASEKGESYNLHDVRHKTLWGTLMAGGGGVEYYFGYKLLENDLVCQDFRSRDQSWDYCRIALAYFRGFPLLEMSNADALVGNAKRDNSRYCLAKKGEVYLVYLPDGKASALDLSDAEGDFAVAWFNPRTGEAGPKAEVKGGAEVTLTPPPGGDWAVSLRKRQRLSIWEGHAPGETMNHVGTALPARETDKPTITRIKDITAPTMVAMVPASGANGTAVVILPGGGFNYVVPDLEGSEAGAFLNEHGITAFVLNYRTKSGDSERPAWHRPLQDSQRAIRYVRAHADQWYVNPNKVGLLAFSAGGQVAAIHIGSHGDAYELKDSIDQLSARPDFAMLVYPWQVGDNVTGELIQEIQLDRKAPPTFIVHTSDDNSSSLGAVSVYAALKKAGVSAELHVYQNGGHGYGTRHRPDSVIGTWPMRAAQWLRVRGLGI